MVLIYFFNNNEELPLYLVLYNSPPIVRCILFWISEKEIRILRDDPLKTDRFVTLDKETFSMAQPRK